MSSTKACGLLQDPLLLPLADFGASNTASAYRDGSTESSRTVLVIGPSAQTRQTP